MDGRLEVRRRPSPGDAPGGAAGVAEGRSFAGGSKEPDAQADKQAAAGEVVQEIGPGACVGAEAMLLGRKSSADVVAATHCEMYSLSRKSLVGRG